MLLYDYGSSNRDPCIYILLYTYIDKLECIPRQGARFIKNYYIPRDMGSMIKMLQELDLQPLQQCWKELTFLFKIAEGPVPAIPSDVYLTAHRTKRRITARAFNNCVSTNLVTKYVTNNSKCYIIPKRSTEE